MTDLTRFMISDTEYIQVLPEPVDKDECEVCAHCDIDYVDEEKNIHIRFGYNFSSSFCYSVAEYGRVQKLIQGEMVLDGNAAKNLGFEWNQYFEGKIKKTIVGNYHCWSNDHKQIRPYFSSWMYNDTDGNIIFEITPNYPWSNEKKKDNPGWISYKKFMESYKPILKTMIPKERLQQWIPQAKKLKKMLVPSYTAENA